MRYAIAGHPLPILVRADGAVSQMGDSGPLLGLDVRVSYSAAELFLAPGDVLVLYTDGVVESRRSGVLFGDQRLMELLGEMVARGAPVRRIAEEPIRAASTYNELHDDDMATLVIRAAAPA